MSFHSRDDNDCVRRFKICMFRIVRNIAVSSALRQYNASLLYQAEATFVTRIRRDICHMNQKGHLSHELKETFVTQIKRDICHTN